MKHITLQDIWHSTLLTQQAKVWARDHMAYLNKPMTLWGTSTKVEKGSDKYETYVMYLQPAGKVALKTLCDAAVASGCEGPCLIQTGHLGMSQGQNAATKRTILMLLRPQWFEDTLLSEVDKAERRALKTGIPALFRPNGTSDCDFSHIISQRPNSQWYDYTKVLSRVRKNTLSHYDLTFSGSMYSVQSRVALYKAVSRGHRVAMAWNTKQSKQDTLALPESGTLSFDTTDIRHKDPIGSMGTLTRKDSTVAERIVENTKHNSFFVTQANVADYNDIILAVSA
jgi:hypothetical protein